jgi:hypothetical protein
MQLRKSPGRVVLSFASGGCRTIKNDLCGKTSGGDGKGMRERMRRLHLIHTISMSILIGNR